MALFLAEWAAITHDDIAHDTARAAFRHALRAVESMAGADHDLYGGRLGVAYSLARAARALDDWALGDSARTVVAGLDTLRNATTTAEFDVISGLAGRVVGLLALSDLLDEASYRSLAEVAARRLLDAGQQAGDCLCWPTNLPWAKPLLGYSHGVAGIALALLEWGTISGDNRYVTAAERAFAYERRHFDERFGNWPDFRKAQVESAPSYATFWCHGAPGIALARLRADELTPKAIWREEARIALKTTYADLMHSQGLPGSNCSLCHGTCGNVEVLLAGQAFLSPKELDDVREVIGARVAWYRDEPARWPCGTNGGSTAGLFLGVAGMGHFLLRLDRPDVPSVLHLRPQASPVAEATARADAGNIRDRPESDER